VSGKRFDLSQLADFESRTGGIGTGALVRNGFVEVDGAGERWSNMRPSLSSGAAAPFAGSGQGMFPIGTDLWLMISGTATRRGTATQTGTAFFMFGTDLGGGAFGYFSTSTVLFGSLSPTVWNGKTVTGIDAVGTTVALRWQIYGTHGTSVLQYIRVGTYTYAMSAVTQIQTLGADPNGYT